MTTPQQKLLRDIVALLCAVAVMAGMVLGLEINIIFTLPVAVLVYLGLYFILNPKSEKELQALESQTAFLNAVGRIKYLIWDLRNKVNQLNEPIMQTRVENICRLADDIIAKIEEQHPQAETVIRLQDKFEQVHQILNGYQELVSGKVVVAPDKFNELKVRIENNVMTQIENSLHDFARDLSREDIHQLEASMEILEMTLKFEKLS